MAWVVKSRNKRGGWVVRWRDPARVERSQTFRRKVDADNFAKTVDADVLRGTYIDPAGGRVLLGEWWDRWWPTQAHLRASTRNRDQTLWLTRVKPTFGNTPLARIGRIEVATWLADLQAAGLAPTTVHKCHQILGKALRAAVDDGMLGSSPTERAPLPRVEPDEMRFLTPKDVERLAGTIDHRYRLLVLTAAYSGLREGELFALRARRVDLLRRHIDVRETVAEVGSEIVFGPPKTRRAARRVPIPTALANELHALVGASQPDELLFPAPHGGPARARLFRRRVWHPAVEEADLAPLRFHDLRHTAVAFWIATGASPQQIAEWAGHTSVRTVLDRYGHLLPGTHEPVMSALDALVIAARETSDGTTLALVRDNCGMESACRDESGRRSVGHPL